MTKKYSEMSLSEVTAEMAELDRRDRIRSESHTDCSTDRDDGPCGHYGESFADAINYCNLRDIKEKLESEERYIVLEDRDD